MTQEPSGFETAVRARSWDWLLELRRRLKVDIQLVDDRQTPLLPFGGGGPTQLCRDSGSSENRPGLGRHANALQTREPQAAAWHGLQIICMALTDERSTPGALVGRMLPHGQDSEASSRTVGARGVVAIHRGRGPSAKSAGLSRQRVNRSRRSRSC